MMRHTPADEHVIATARTRLESGKPVRRQRFTVRVVEDDTHTRVTVALYGIAFVFAGFAIVGALTTFH